MAEHWIVETVPSDDPDEQEAARLWNALGPYALDMMTEAQLDALLRIWERDR